ncbi:type VI secretion system Vgr family protein [Phyllobacterium myrsinacearum]|uniref:Type VI secretion system tip protein VgrG n=1 Tax=Phyllobacterium myrsinacearum TaxID=28101 RepID=A0A2S9JAT9_9HYPH|nr:type VI secretion system tip protein TssI/VgrG [Phyllobacterium myrsinacearum]PRD49906.1 type VI secretion system tip protein VgrG [Phyllobacterium myrsinacearum]PWV83338.1 type VI secretion system secreted protein VgrG [Phyllobacterium myrsinacearum]RZS76743.1 type VI secretion system secreted protein VgrG [Phyllobacterium myrsinacearum]RZU96739.1 type VI secretion system secreted protein VgrG [Phyllobacterium myrsinacearum]
MEYEFFDAGLIQANRILRISTSLGLDVLLAEKVDIHEEINGLFEIHVDVKSKRTDIKPEELVGTMADVSLEIAYGERRPWNGLITGFREGPPVSRGLRSYRLVIRPQLWLLSQRSDCRIFMDMTTLQIAETLLSEHGIKAAVTGGVITPTAPMHYSVQWNETDLAYLTRRLEADGLFYWFEHEDGQHALHVASHPFGYTEGPETDVRFAAGSTDRNHISEFARDYRFTPGKRAGGDWNFEKPQGPQGSVTPSLVSLPKNAEYELFHYPAKALDQSSNEQASKLRMQAVEADHEKIEGSSTVRTLAAGRKFKPYEIAHADHVFEEYVVTAIVHRIVDHSYETADDGALDYSNNFIALPSRLPATPHRSTPQPRVDGSQVAIVAGPLGEEIHPDEYGRIKVWFPWQRNRARKDGSDTCWIRVMQSWAGGGFGAQVIPRIGMEVMVTYLEGDPDRPVVTGIVPNPSTKVPYKLPENKTKSVFRTQTHKGDGFNELSFEDERGREEVLLRAQRDLTVKVENHLTERVDSNRISSIGAMSHFEVEQSHSENIGRNYTINVGTMGGSAIVGEILKNRIFGMLPAAYHLEATNNERVGSGHLSINSSSSISMNTTNSYSVEVTGIHMSTIGVSKTTNVGGSSFHSAGGDHRDVVGGKRMIDAHGEIHLRCGKSEIIMKPDGVITLKGTQLIVEEKDHINMKAGRIDLNA